MTHITYRYLLAFANRRELGLKGRKVNMVSLLELSNFCNFVSSWEFLSEQMLGVLAEWE